MDDVTIRILAESKRQKGKAKMKKAILFGCMGAALALTSCGGTTLPVASSDGGGSNSATPLSESESEQGSDSFSSVVTSYQISFYDEAGVLLTKESYEEGEVPAYAYSKADTQEWDYTFLGWSASLNGDVLPSLPAVSGDASYYAVIEETKQQYTITFLTNGGSEVSPIKADYGSQIEKPDDPLKDGYRFIGWAEDAELTETVSWPYTILGNATFYAAYNEKVDIKAYLSTLVGALGQDPFSYIPDSMRPTNSSKIVSEADVTYDFSSFVGVSSIHYGGYGEQWNMVIHNIIQSERFYAVLGLCETATTASVAVFNNYLDSNVSDTADHSIADSDKNYSASLRFADGVLSYTLTMTTGWNLPFFGEVKPQIDMVFDVAKNEKSVRINLTDTNALKYVIGDNSYEFALEYGVEAGSRKATFSVTRDSETGEVDGHIYEFVQLKGKDLVPSCADFYIGDAYASVVGNKASGIIGFSGYINELYSVSDGKLRGYKIREMIKSVTTLTYNTLWFNLNDISGIASTKVLASSGDGTDSSFNPNDVYVNGSSSVFTPAYNTKLGIKTSRKYDIELRKQYWYGYQDEDLCEYETDIPMMFIQDDNDKDTNYSDFSSDMKSVSGINSSVTLSSSYLTKIRADYNTLIDVFVANKDSITGDIITQFIGNAA
ncbi:MAG: InlB B-repeat-containing protein [Bacilli bacterium]|jgi:hypothetical protein|nr:InlB B-repeat-containing protein [Bacilli bacterium]